jgi:hypothetical protein
MPLGMVLFIFLIISGLSGCSFPGRQAAVGELSVIPAEVELRAEDGSDHVREVICRLINRTDTDVQILNVSTSCACTLSEPLAISKLAPSTETRLRLRVTIPSHGRKEVVVQVATSPPSVAPPSIRLVLIGAERKLPYVESPPAELRLRGYKSKEWVSRECDVVTVEQAGTKPWIKGVAVSDDEIQANIAPAPIEQPYGPIQVKRTYRLTIRGSLPEDEGRDRYHSVIIITDNRSSAASESSYVIRVTTSIDPLVHIVPRAISLRKSQVDRWPVTRNVILISPTGSQLSLHVSDPLPPWIVVTLLPVPGNESSQFVRVEIHEPPSSSNQVSETIRLTARGTIDGDTIVEIPISVLANDAQ